MKKLLKFLPLLLVAVIGLAMTACDKDDDELIVVNKLPSKAQEFIRQYYGSSTILSAVKDGNEYEVTLSNGTRIDFNKDGEWRDVEAGVGKTIVSGFYPAAIDTYVETNHSGDGINEITKDGKKYDVELVSGTDLVFDHDGTFIDYDI